MKEITISDKESNQRLDKFLLKYFNKAPKSFVYKMLRKKRIKLNKSKGDGSEILQSGDTLQMYISDETTSDLQNNIILDGDTKISFKVLYEDRNILVVNKPAGVLSQKESDDTKNCLIDQVIFYLWEKGEFNPDSENTFIPALCNRLDRNTSGIVIVGKSVMALQEISKMFQNDKISKHYLALVKGQVKHKETLKAFLTKDSRENTVTVTESETLESKAIITKYDPIMQNEKFSYLDVLLKTGRPHQIRAHLAFAGFPIVGDKKYGHKGTNMTFLRKYELNHQFLHSYKIVFSNMEGDFSYLNSKEVCALLPDNLNAILEDVFKT